MDQPIINIKIAGRNFVTFDHRVHGPCGVGRDRQKLIVMDQYVDHSADEDLHWEICRGLAMIDNRKIGMAAGPIPPEILERNLYCQSWAEMFRDLDRYDPTGVHRKNLEIISASSTKQEAMQAMYRYAYFGMGAAMPWFFMVYLKYNSFATKTKDQSDWTDQAKLFPRVVEYVNTLPFKEVGRVLIMTTYPGAGVVVHRDSVVAEHKDHNINFFFAGGWRPTFVYDERDGTKHYLPTGTRSYFSNNRDYHGVDAAPEFRYTLRVDGTFTDELCERLGMEDGYTWKWSYADHIDGNSGGP